MVEPQEQEPLSIKKSFLETSLQAKWLSKVIFMQFSKIVWWGLLRKQPLELKFTFIVRDDRKGCLTNGTTKERKDRVPHARKNHSRLKFSFSVWNFHSRLKFSILGLVFLQPEGLGMKKPLSIVKSSFRIASLIFFNIASRDRFSFNPGALWVLSHSKRPVYAINSNRTPLLVDK